MSEKKKSQIKELVSNLKELDKNSLSIIQAGAQMLKARQDMEQKEAGNNDNQRAAGEF